MKKHIYFLALLCLNLLIISCSSDDDDMESETFTTSISDTSLAFGDVTVPATSDQTFSVTSTGTGTITITNITTPTGFSIQPTNATIASGNAQVFTVTFSPTAGINYSGNISITSNATSSGTTVAVSGTGIVTSIANYYDEVEPIITPNCVNTVGCHSASDSSGGVNLSTYELVKLDFQDMSASGSMSQIENGFMPQGAPKLSDADISILQNWIDNDYQEGTPPVVASYINDIAPIMAQSCATAACHDNSSPKAGLDLSTFALVKTSFQETGTNSSIGRIERGNMPKNGSKLAQSKIDLIKNWIDNDFLQQ